MKSEYRMVVVSTFGEFEIAIERLTADGWIVSQFVGGFESEEDARSFTFDGLSVS